MGTVIVGGVLAIAVGLIVFSMIRKYRRGKSILCDSGSCGTCGTEAICRSNEFSAKKNVGKKS